MHRFILSGAMIFLALLQIVPPGSAAEPMVIDRFEGDLSAWEVQKFKGQTDYRLEVAEAGNRVLAASSHDSASGLIKKIEFDPKEYPVLTWRWKIERTLSKGNAHTKEGDDYAARLYVIFPHWIKPLTRTINYIWANRLSQGEAVPNSYFSRAMMLAVESGDGKTGEWISEQRNLLDDYRTLFGEDPPKAGGVAIMTDTDNTGEATRAWYDDLVLAPAD